MRQRDVEVLELFRLDNMIFKTLFTDDIMDKLSMNFNPGDLILRWQIGISMVKLPQQNKFKEKIYVASDSYTLDEQGSRRATESKQ